MLWRVGPPLPKRPPHPDSPARKAEDLVEIAILVRKARRFTTGVSEPAALQEIAPRRAGGKYPYDTAIAAL